MSPANVPHALEPGTLLVDRYRLDEHLGDSGGSTYWRADDELLDRPVGICLLGEGESNAQEVLTAARKAAAVSDPRFLRVLDANENDGVVYVVSEWVSATSLADLVSDRPLTPGAARELAAEVAGALDVAHREGLAHLCLTPEHVLRTAHGQVKVAGLAVDAAVQGRHEADPEQAAARDTRGVAAVLYAALTARWPGQDPTAVAPAPYDGDNICTPRQVRAGVPDDLDALVASTLEARQRHGHGPEPARTPAELAGRLGAGAATSRIPVVREPTERSGDTPPPFVGGPYVARYDDDGRRAGRLAGRAAYVLVGLVLLVGLGLVVWQLRGLGDGTGNADGNGRASSSPKAGAGTQTLTVQADATLDPPPQGNGEENPERAGLAHDGKVGTSWNTKSYDQQLGPGGIKDGVGLLLDLGAKKSISQVQITFVGSPTSFQVRVADSRGTALGDYRRVGGTDGAGERADVKLDSPATGRWVLIWLTRLPNAGGGYEGRVAEVTVRGGND